VKLAAAFVLLTALALAYAQRSLRMENDLVSSLKAKDPEFGQVFERAQSSGLFRGRIFVEPPAGARSLPAELSAALVQEGYKATAFGAANPSPVALLPLAVHLPAVQIEDALSEKGLAARRDDILAGMMLPGGEALADLASVDPLGFLPRLADRFAQAIPGSASLAAPADTTPVFVFESPKPLDFDRVERIHGALQAAKVRFIGEDFFAYENYATIQRDILVCALLALPLNVFLYFVFIRNRRFLLFTLAGNVVSYAWGLFAGAVFFPAFFGVALAFTTTFLSFNNEYLVHLSGTHEGKSKGRFLGVLSAIGTTFLGFVALLFGSSDLVRQIAVLSLGGMAGFLAFLWVFRRVMARITFRTFRWRMVSLGPRTLGAATLVCAALFVVALPTVATHVSAFRSFTPELEGNIAHFTARAQGLSGGLPMALEVDASENVSSVVAAIAAQGDVRAQTPWAFFASNDVQRENVVLLQTRAAAAVTSLRESLVKLGIDVPMNPGAYGVLGVQDLPAFCTTLESLSPLPVCAKTKEGGFFIFLTRDAKGKASAVAPGQALAPNSPLISSAPLPGGATRRAWSLEAERYYDSILTGFSRELAALFAAGLVAMIAYLWTLHRALGKIVYILFPVLLSAVAVFLWLRATGGSLNIIHMLAFSLVISVGLDYSSIALSSRYQEDDMSRVLLTGLSTLAGFGVLAAARHPVLRDLGMVVCLGAGLSLAFAVVFRYSPASSEARPS